MIAYSNSIEASLAINIANNIYLAYARGESALADQHWMQTPNSLQGHVRKHLDQRIVECDSVSVFEQCVGWNGMAKWLRDYQPNMALDVVAQCPRILAAWWNKVGPATWTSWAHQSLGSLLWLDVCNFLAGGHWHLWGGSEDHLVSHLSHYYEAHPNTLSVSQQKALKNHVDAFALTNERFMVWLKKQTFYNPNWDETLFIQTHNHHRHACAFDARLLNPHSRAVAHYVNQLRTGKDAPFTDGYWFFPAESNPDAIFARLLIAACSDTTFYCNTLVNVEDPKYRSLRQSLALHQAIDPDLSMLVQWLRSHPTANWGRTQESIVGPW